MIYSSYIIIVPTIISPKYFGDQLKYCRPNEVWGDNSSCVPRSLDTWQHLNNWTLIAIEHWKRYITDVSK